MPQIHREGLAEALPDSVVGESEAPCLVPFETEPLVPGEDLRPILGGQQSDPLVAGIEDDNGDLLVRNLCEADGEGRALRERLPADTGTLIAHTFEVPAMTAAGEFVINSTVDCRGKFLAIRTWYWDNALGDNAWWEGAIHSEHPAGYDVERSPASDVAIEEFSDSNFFLEVDKNTDHLKWRWLQYGGTVYLVCEVRVMNLPDDIAS